jgi:pimeloyl-ACP methyl ester carboxylesterase
MKTKKLKKTLAVFLLVISFNLAPIAFLQSVVLGEEECSEDDDCWEEPLPEDTERNIYSYKEWNTDMLITESLTINAGATLVIKKGVTVRFGRYGSLNVLGKLFVKGTLKNPIVFKRAEDFASSQYSYSIKVSSNGEANIMNADISGGGMYPVYLMYNPFINTAYAASPTGVIDLSFNAKLKISSSRIHDNNMGITANPKYGADLVVNRTAFSDNALGEVVCNNTQDGILPDFRYNWWGKSTGPETRIDNGEDERFQIINENINFSNWLTEEKFQDPVIIIPGILGSQKKDGQWQLEQTLHVYDNLYSEFANNGYVPEKDLFKFPYEWRDSNVENAKLLKIKIQEIKTKNNWPKVDILAHSMGGLLAREYIESDDYANDVDQLITLGTPHLGSPEAYLKWDGDGWFWGMADIYAKRVLGQEAHEGNYADIFDYIHQRPIASLQELLPVYDYLQAVENGNKYKTYFAGYPRNEFLENLNSVDEKNKLNNIEFDKIIGNAGSESGTTSGFKVIDADMGKLWKHGYPHGFEIPLIGDRGMLKSGGDGTVPLFSAESVNISEDEKIVINSGHTNLPTDAQKDILELLTGKRPKQEVRDSLVKNIFVVSVFSPIDIQLIDPNGKKVGKDFEHAGQTFNEISGAFYSGYETENEFITIPNPIDGEYKITSKGTGSGEYKIEVAKISEADDSAQSAKESLATFTGTAISGGTETINAIVNGDIVEDKNKIATTTTTTTANSISDDNTKHKSNSDNNNNKKTKTKSNSVETFLAKDNRQSIDPNLDNPLKNANNIFADASKLEKTFPDTEVSGAETKTKNKFNKFWIILGIIIGGGVSWFLVRRKKFWFV